MTEAAVGRDRAPEEAGREVGSALETVVGRLTEGPEAAAAAFADAPPSLLVMPDGACAWGRAHIGAVLSQVVPPSFTVAGRVLDMAVEPLAGGGPAVTFTCRVLCTIEGGGAGRELELRAAGTALVPPGSPAVFTLLTLVGQPAGPPPHRGH
ncbi:MAG TPA: hypothetical protein VKA65_18220 [Acidimicrobiales bacterium]|nr:hypothetical protein [Acidimicrobiales bacterium]